MLTLTRNLHFLRPFFLGISSSDCPSHCISELLQATIGMANFVNAGDIFGSKLVLSGNIFYRNQDGYYEYPLRRGLPHDIGDMRIKVEYVSPGAAAPVAFVDVPSTICGLDAINISFSGEKAVRFARRLQNCRELSLVQG